MSGLVRKFKRSRPGPLQLLNPSFSTRASEQGGQARSANQGLKVANVVPSFQHYKRFFWLLGLAFHGTEVRTARGSMRVGSFFSFTWDLRSMHLLHFCGNLRQVWRSVVAYVS